MKRITKDGISSTELLIAVFILVVSYLSFLLFNFEFGFVGTAYAESVTTVENIKVVEEKDIQNLTVGLKDDMVAISLAVGDTDTSHSIGITTKYYLAENASMTEEYCGDGNCQSGEDATDCPEDCDSSCPNRTCDEPIENCQSCSADCGECPYCGDGSCDSGEGETCVLCEDDCGDCCGNGSCEEDLGEDCLTCPGDCGDCCGNGSCDFGETCVSCPEDCGPCGPVCGDLSCDPGEHCGNCPNDCICYCGDGYCSPPLEDKTKCPQDCEGSPPIID